MSWQGARLPQPLRCAIYTRADNAEQHACAEAGEWQRDICGAFLRGQPQRDWVEATETYDDVNCTGGNLERPALTRLLADIERGAIDIVMVSRLDRLARSLRDFETLTRCFEKHEVGLVSVAQPFDSQDGNGKLILDVLHMFGAFEREQHSDRNRASRAAMRLNGRWPGGRVPLGYDVVDGRLAVNAAEAETVRRIYELFVETESCKKVASALARTPHRAKSWTGRDGKRRGGGRIGASAIYWIIGRRLYLGEIEEGGRSYRGTHPAIVERATFERAMQLREQNSVPTVASRTRRSFLLGLLYDGEGRRMIVDRRSGDAAEYRYYASFPEAEGVGPARLRAHADSLERLVLIAICAFLRDRFRISGAVFRTGCYDPRIEALLDGGPAAAERLEGLDRTSLRLALERLIVKIELSFDQARILVSCPGLLDLLGWDGVGLFRGKSGRREAPQVHAIEVETASVRVDGSFSLPVEPRPQDAVATPNPRLVSLIEFAREVLAALHANRHLTLEQLALRFDRRPAFLARAVRINYLAPDIVLAILDGRQPAPLSRKDLLFTAFPMDWAQQRALLGFPPMREDSVGQERAPGGIADALGGEAPEPARDPIDHGPSLPGEPVR